MRLVRRLARSAGVLLVLVAAGCSGSDEPDTVSLPEADLAAGEAVYAASCESCHGADLEGTDQGPSHLSIVYEPDHHGDDAFRSAIANGSPQHHWEFGPMPPVEGLTEADVTAVVAYIRAEQRARGFQE